MVRKLKYHEQKLLKKVDFTTYKSDNNHRQAAVVRRYHIQKPDDYRKYSQLCGSLRQLAHRLANLEPSDPFRRKHEDLLLEKLHDMGILGTGGGGKGKLSDVEHKVTVSAFARRRLPVVMTRLRMADTVQAATKFIEQGHVRVGTEVVTDTAYLVTRNMEDFVTWVDSSKIKRNIMKYRDKLDDFELEAI
ncbi:alpha-L RNA-binding motif-containing protein [Westerdykella ornata]|uniref:U3 small nucleolar ribonucleoprotein protein IMP3 n=1 Tax=Westerdykella ornata TaxID=318751 RepID=A0A6A6JEW1_WESOR|nr:alpha-L RNA-binding motif-containing protein [Westerdykella ornata]KAF2274805.1 alpha-L RNA-binding motif-containing protein [Westerdykella ornata]